MEISKTPNREQKVFNQLTEQLNRLRAELADVSALLDKQLQYFVKHLHPLTMEVVDLRVKAVILLNGFMTISKGLSEHEKEALGRLIINQLHEIFRHQQEDPEGELLEIFNAISEVSYQDLMTAYFTKLRTIVDTPPTDDIHPVKNKKQLRERILEDSRQKSIQQLYRQLAKVLHPDLEQDPTLIGQKEELMKQLTVAKERGDLLTMLQLELSWMQQGDRPPDKLKLYNATLREQVKDLQSQIQAVFLHPRYECLQSMARSPQALRFIDWKSEKRNLENLREGLEHIILGLSQDTRKALKVVKEVITSF